METFRNPDDLKKAIKNLDASFVPSEENIRVVRGLEGNNEFLRRLEFALDNNWYSKGDIISEKGYLSTTIKADTGINFTTRIMYVIDVPKGKKILPIKGKIHADEEFEFLLPRNSKLKITDTQKQDLKGYDETHYVVHFELK